MGSMSVGTNAALVKKKKTTTTPKPTTIGLPSNETKPTANGNLSMNPLTGMLTRNPVAPAIPTGINNKPVSKTIAKYLTNDSAYQGQTAALEKAYSDFVAQKSATEGEYNVNYGNNKRDLNKAQENSTRDQADDFASRGIYRSGVFAKAAGDMSNDYANRYSDLDTTKSQFLAGSNRDFSNFRASNQLARQQAVQDAIQRRALGLVTGSN